ncbi:MAG: TatD family hydrolase [Rhodospirillaceae bacterium]|jgi:TatD DNase family protein|nr:TatD family hydrolase [Rhodospirillaceae bacterium]MBT4937865.1 TatD family hydrolase [Rhodospirillaceae bacterium]MBT5939922.1 TatD family hydrolase [Rhodospirillaceae bacterium]MBT7267027.1 TatD family hydrolase [Rhodospirillaceae bacterium]
MLVDSHCHLNYEGLAEDIEGTVARAGEAGVGFMLSIGTRLSDFDAVLATAKAYENVACTVGIHPHESGKEPETDVETLVELTQHPKVVGIGETGLDFFYDNSPRDAQERSFRTHIAVARETQLPIVVHTRDADERTIAIIDEEQEKGTFPGLIHCFSAGPELAKCAVSHGMAISLSGIITFNSAEPIRETVKSVPLEQILVETDAPFLAPIPHRGKTNEPAFVAHTAAKAAEIFEIEVEELARQTTDNFFRLFSKAERPA